MPSPYPWHYTIRWPFYFQFPSTRNHAKIPLTPDAQKFCEPQDDAIKLLFCGDIMVHNGDRIPTLDKKLCDLIASADFFIGNCEAPVGEHPLNSNKKYSFQFHMPRVYFTDILQQTGLPASQWILSIANNHTGDMGYQACLDSYKILNEIGITQLGRYQKNTIPLEIKEINNMRIGFIAWTHWMNYEIFPEHDLGAYRTEHVKNQDWHKIKEDYKLDYLIAIPHWEYEFQHFPHKSSRQFAKKLIEEMGIDTLVGIHPHSLQPMEQFQNGFCFYSLGNFYGLGVAWSVKLITLLELVLNPGASNNKKVSSYKLHYFFQHEEDNTRNLIPLENAPTSKRNKILKRLKKIYKI